MFKFRNATYDEAVIIPRDQHNITRANISSNALKVLYRLRDAGFSAYLVGGSVRDLLLDRHPKDFDVATNARPEQIKKVFRNCLLIGRRFRLAHIRFGNEIIEVATFRAAQSSKFNRNRHTADHGMILRDNVYGTIEEDVKRRDFTINALYYNIKDYSIVDYCGGVADLKQQILKMIGEPRQRYHEDPVRLLRVIRFAGKLGFQIDPATEAPMAELAPLLSHVPAARLFEEVLKLFHSGNSMAILPLLQRYKLFDQLFPQLASCLESEYKTFLEKLLLLICSSTDDRINSDKPVSPGFLFASLLWYPLQRLVDHHVKQGHIVNIARNIAGHEIIAKQMEQITIPRRFSTTMREIWDMQFRFSKTNQKQVTRLIAHPRFRAAYDFLLLRAEAGENIHAIAKWWQQFYEADTVERQKLMETIPKSFKRRRKRKKSS